jgi:transcriptional antiterminator RfaH
MTTGAEWHLVHTQPNNEARADVNLRRQGFTTYLPCYQRQRRHARRSDVVVRPLFPRYLFVRFDLGRDQWRSVQSTFGVSALVFAGEKPAALPNHVVDEIRAREDGSGFVVLGLPAGLKPGSAVRLVDGLFADYQGVLERIADERRVSVLLSLLGRQVRVFVPAASVAVA